MIAKKTNHYRNHIQDSKAQVSVMGIIQEENNDDDDSDSDTASDDDY